MILAAVAILAMSFTTEAQYTPRDVDKIVVASGLPAAQNIIGIDPNWGGAAQRARQAIAKKGAKLHVYHQGPGMREFGESSSNWVGKLRSMLLKHREAETYEVDNIDQLGIKYYEWIIAQQKWQKANGIKAKLVIKNPEAALLKKIRTSKVIDQDLVSDFVILEVGRGGVGAAQTKRVTATAKALGMTVVPTYDTYNYKTRAPTVHRRA